MVAADPTVAVPAEVRAAARRDQEGITKSFSLNPSITGAAIPKGVTAPVVFLSEVLN
jgi:hypothetical protein